MEDSLRNKGSISSILADFITVLVDFLPVLVDLSPILLDLAAHIFPFLCLCLDKLAVFGSNSPFFHCLFSLPVSTGSFADWNKIRLRRISLYFNRRAGASQELQSI